mgnify:CR=1 FL=1
MKNDIVLPNYDHCILNTVTSILKYYSVEEIGRMLEQNQTENPRNEYFNTEIKTIIEHYRREKLLSDVER